jgi:hypothetical protein
LPIWIRPGEGSIKGGKHSLATGVFELSRAVFFAIIFYAAWEFFIIHLLLGIILVAISNNKYVLCYKSRDQRRSADIQDLWHAFPLADHADWATTQQCLPGLDHRVVSSAPIGTHAERPN